MHSDRQSLHLVRTRAMGTLAAMAVLAGMTWIAGCGSTYRPVVSAINPVGPAGQPTKYAVAISSPSTTAPGLVTLIDFSGDTILNTTAIGVSPQYLVLSSGGGEAYVINGDHTVNSFNISTSLLSSNLQSTPLPTGSTPVSLFPQTVNTYISVADPNPMHLNYTAQLVGTPPALQQQLPTGLGSIYTVGVANAPRVYEVVQGNNVAPGNVSAIETTTNTISNTIPVGVNPVYGVMTADASRAFILNHGSNTVSVVNAQTNALDTFTTAAGVASTIPVGTGPIWADFAPTLNELVVLNQGNGTTPGSVSIISIPKCPATTVVSNPTCDPADPLDALGFGSVLATIPVGINPIMIGVLQDGSKAYVANAGNATNPGSISVINLTNNTVSATIPASASGNPTDALVHGHPGYIAVTTGTPTGKVYVTALDSTDITIIRTDIDAVQTHLALQGNGVAVRVTLP